jgi:ADP-heptose:LPS heptosyltransferase
MSAANSIRIGALFPGALGDFICFLPALEVLWQNAEVDVFARTEFRDLVPTRVKVRSLECFEVRRLFAPDATVDERLTVFFGSYAAIYSWTGSGQKEFVDQLITICRGRARIYPFRADDRASHHSDYYLSCLDKTFRHPRAPNVALRPDAVAWSKKYWVKHSMDGKAVLVLAPGSGAREKNWPATFYHAVADWWRHRTQGAVVVLIGPVEEERGGLEVLLNRSIVASGLTLAQVAALLARSDLYLGNDSGITHLAAAVGVRTVALFGPSDLHQWAPRGQKIATISRAVECSPCVIPVMKSCPHRKCLTQVYPADVIEELEKLPEIIGLTRGGVGIRV